MTVYALFSDDFKNAVTNKGADPYFNIVTLFVLAAFIIEINECIIIICGDMRISPMGKIRICNTFFGGTKQRRLNTRHRSMQHASKIYSKRTPLEICMDDLLILLIVSCRKRCSFLFEIGERSLHTNKIIPSGIIEPDKFITRRNNCHSGIFWVCIDVPDNVFTQTT